MYDAYLPCNGLVFEEETNIFQSKTPVVPSTQSTDLCGGEYFPLVRSDVTTLITLWGEYFPLVRSDVTTLITLRGEYFPLVRSDVTTLVTLCGEYFPLVRSDVTTLIKMWGNISL